VLTLPQNLHGMGVLAPLLKKCQGERSGTLVSIEPQGVVILVEGDPGVARPNEYRFYTWAGLTFIAQEATG
jgi:hypothetical protein